MVRTSILLLPLIFYFSCSRSFDGSVDNISFFSATEDSALHAISLDADRYVRDREMGEEKAVSISGKNERRDVKFSARYTAIGLESVSCADVRKIFATFSAARFAGIFRGAQDRISRAGSFYAKASLSSVPLDLHAGDIRPDFAAGGLAGGARGSERYVRYSLLKEPLWIAPGASFYGTSLRGIAATSNCRAFRAGVFAGRKRILRSGKVSLVEPSIAGARFEVRRVNMLAGLSYLASLDEKERHLISADTRYSSGTLELVLEIVSAPGRESGAAAAFSWKIRKFRAGLLAYTLPPMAVSPLSSINGVELRSGESNSGSCFSLASKLFDRLTAKLAIEQRLCEKNFERRETSFACAEIGKDFKRVELRFSVQHRSSEETVLIPTPSFRSGALKKEYSGQIMVSAEHGFAGKFAASLENISQCEGRAILLRSTLARGFFSDRVKCAAFYSRFDAISGNPRGIYYEPSLSGAYPFVSVSHDRERIGIVISFVSNRLTLSCKAIYEVRSALSISAEAKLEI